MQADSGQSKNKSVKLKCLLITLATSVTPILCLCHQYILFYFGAHVAQRMQRGTKQRTNERNNDANGRHDSFILFNFFSKFYLNSSKFRFRLYAHKFSILLWFRDYYDSYWRKLCDNKFSIFEKNSFYNFKRVFREIQV